MYPFNHYAGGGMGGFNPFSFGFGFGNPFSFGGGYGGFNPYSQAQMPRQLLGRMPGPVPGRPGEYITDTGMHIQDMMHRPWLQGGASMGPSQAVGGGAASQNMPGGGGTYWTQERMNQATAPNMGAMRQPGAQGGSFYNPNPNFYSPGPSGGWMAPPLGRVR